MGGLGPDAHKFIRECHKRNRVACNNMLDVLVTQHAKYTAERIQRALFGQSRTTQDHTPTESPVAGSTQQKGRGSQSRLHKAFEHSSEPPHPTGVATPLSSPARTRVTASAKKRTGSQLTPPPPKTPKSNRVRDKGQASLVDSLPNTDTYHVSFA